MGDFPALGPGWSEAGEHPRVLLDTFLREAIRAIHGKRTSTGESSC